MTTTTRTFANLAEWIDYADGCPASKRAESDTRGSDGRAFTGTGSLREACDLAHGWDEGARQVEARKVAVRASVGTASRREVRMREVGPGTLSMGAYLSGHPQPYVTLNNRNVARRGKGKIVRIRVNFTASGAVPTSIITRRGGAVCALIEALEAAGRRVELTAVVSVKGTTQGSKWIARIMVKRAEQRLNLPVVAYALAHPSMLRRLMFAAIEREDAKTRTTFRVGFGYGTPIEDSPEDAGTIYLGCMLKGDGPWMDDKKAAEWVRETLTEQGITLK